MELVADEELVTTTDIARITGRNDATIRSAIRAGHIPQVTRTTLGRPLVRLSDALAWHKAIRPPAPHTPPTWDATATALATLGPSTPDEIAAYRNLHPGNIRKHLAILAAQRRAEQRADGHWTVTAGHGPTAPHIAAEEGSVRRHYQKRSAVTDRIVVLLQEHPSLYLAQLVAATGVNQSTVRRCVQDLLNAGHITPLPRISGSRAVPYQLTASRPPLAPMMPSPSSPTAAQAQLDLLRHDGAA